MFRLDKGLDEVLLSMVKRLDHSRVKFTDSWFYLPSNQLPRYKKEKLCFFFNLVGPHIRKLDLTNSTKGIRENFNMPFNLRRVEEVLQRCPSVSEIALSVSANSMIPASLTDLIKVMPVKRLYLSLFMEGRLDRRQLLMFNSIADCCPNIIFLKVKVVHTFGDMQRVSLKPFTQIPSLSILQFIDYGIKHELQLVDFEALRSHPSFREIHLFDWVLDQHISTATVVDAPLSSGINVIIINQNKIYNLPKAESA
mmetsp:Transcript_37509/g.60774  ORF Transcript_37509/g.60774 Transcript_37509/m.60774 type:complete len:253 (+) Transcript_37509:292-1050(+)